MIVTQNSIANPEADGENTRLREMLVELEEAAVQKSVELTVALEELETHKEATTEMETMKKAFISEQDTRETLIAKERAAYKQMHEEELDADRSAMEDAMLEDYTCTKALSELVLKTVTLTLTLTVGI